MLSGCASQTLPPASNPYKIKKLPESATTYLSQAQSAKPVEQAQYDFLAIAKLLQDDSTTAAAQLLNRINVQSLTSTENAQLRTLQAYLLLKRNMPKQALARIRLATNIQLLNPQAQLLYYQAASEAYARNHKLKTSMLMQLSALSLQPSLSEKSLIPTWKQLLQLPLDKLQAMQASTNNLYISAWLQLAIASKQYNQQPQNLVNAIKTWQIDHPQHSANVLIPSLNQLSSAQTPNTPSKIALLLPSQGPYAAMGTAVKRGFFASYFQYHKTHPQAPTITVYDTSNQDIKTVYEKAVNDGAQLIIGPLDKSKVATLSDWSGVSVPTIALNYSNKPVESDNLIEFGLSPTQSAVQSAELAWEQGASKLLIIKQKNNWYQSVSNAFVNEWQALGGKIVGVLTIHKGTLAPQIADILQTNYSQLREKQLSTLLKQKFVFTPRKRHDANGIFLLTTPSLAKQVKPLLNFYYAGQLPVFSTSLIYNGYQQVGENHDLDGIYFNDMPWVITDSPFTQSLKSSIQRLWPQNFLQYSRLYAVGIDSFTLGMNFTRLLYLPDFPIQGVTGNLFLNGQHEIMQELVQAKFTRGRAVKL